MSLAARPFPTATPCSPRWASHQMRSCAREPLAGGLSGSRVTRLTLARAQPGGATVYASRILKEVRPLDGWLGILSHDEFMREIALREWDILRDLPHGIDTATVCWVRQGGLAGSQLGCAAACATSVGTSCANRFAHRRGACRRSSPSSWIDWRGSTRASGTIARVTDPELGAMASVARIHCCSMRQTASRSASPQVILPSICRSPPRAGRRSSASRRPMPPRRCMSVFAAPRPWFGTSTADAVYAAAWRRLGAESRRPAADASRAARGAAAVAARLGAGDGGTGDLRSALALRRLAYARSGAAARRLSRAAESAPRRAGHPS